ncbi:MAG: hypothetical protein JWQ04_2024 [Pedosphaera sp.]|nr:hypothetical protein [Pedosphaera sp.]
MKYAARLVGLALLVIILSGLTWLVLRPKEPAYHGRALMDWLLDYADADAPHQIPVSSEALREASSHAVKTIGTNGIPILIKMIEARDITLKRKLESALGHHHPIDLNIFISHSNESYLGPCGFEILGREGCPAIPQLSQLAESSNADVRVCALHALSYIKPGKEKMLPILSRLLCNSNKGVRITAFEYLQSLYPEEATQMKSRPNEGNKTLLKQ